MGLPDTDRATRARQRGGEVPALAVLLACGLAVAGDPTPDAAADALHQQLAGTLLVLPDGSSAPVTAAGDRSAGVGSRVLLTRDQLRTCLETVSEAGAWPVAWLIVRHASEPFDLVLRIELDARGSHVTAAPVFATERREWAPGEVRAIARRATGKKIPRRGAGTLVIQEFTTRTETRYVYDAAPSGEGAGGLAALLEPGALIREARTVSLRPGERHTLALVLRHAEFLPSACDDCAARALGHSDTGEVELVLAGEAEIESRLDLTDRLAGPDGRPRVPRYACVPEDERAGPPSPEQVRDRPRVVLLTLRDLDGDGRSLEVSLPTGRVDCRGAKQLDVALDPATGKLRTVGTHE